MRNNVRNKRLELGWSIRKLHDESGVSCGHISDIENGKYIPSLKTALKLARGMKQPVGELFPDLAAGPERGA